MTATPVEARTLDLLHLTHTLAVIAKACPDLTPNLACRGAELDLEVTDRDVTALCKLMDGHRWLPATHLYDGGYGGTIAGTPVRVLIVRRRWAA